MTLLTTVSNVLFGVLLLVVAIVLVVAVEAAGLFTRHRFVPLVDRRVLRSSVCSYPRAAFVVNAAKRVHPVCSN